jgi:hypothetical protein
MREVIFERPKWYIKPAEIATSSEKKEKGEEERLRKAMHSIIRC